MGLLLFIYDHLNKKRHTFRRREKIKGRKCTAALFESGKRFALPPIQVVYKIGTGVGLQAGFAVGTRHFKKATARNRIKRLMRESFRLHKPLSEQLSAGAGKGTAVFFIYTGKEIPQQQDIHQKIKAAIDKLQSIIQ